MLSSRICAVAYEIDGFSDREWDVRLAFVVYSCQGETLSEIRGFASTAHCWRRTPKFCSSCVGVEKLELDGRDLARGPDHFLWKI